MNGHGAKFSRKMEEAVAALLTQRNIEEAAKAAGIGANTLTTPRAGSREHSSLVLVLCQIERDFSVFALNRRLRVSLGGEGPGLGRFDAAKFACIGPPKIPIWIAEVVE
jgi:hypothetical protein